MFPLAYCPHPTPVCSEEALAGPQGPRRIRSAGGHVRRLPVDYGAYRGGARRDCRLRAEGTAQFARTTPGAQAQTAPPRRQVGGGGLRPGAHTPSSQRLLAPPVGRSSLGSALTPRAPGTICLSPIRPQGGLQPGAPTLRRQRAFKHIQNSRPCALGAQGGKGCRAGSATGSRSGRTN